MYEAHGHRVEYYKKFYHSGVYNKYSRLDWVGVTTLLTFYWDITIETIEFAKLMVKDTKNIMVGGVMASIQPDEIEKATGIRPHIGTLHIPYKDIDKENPYIIDELLLDYSILDEIDYVYPAAHVTATLQEGVYENAPFVSFGESSRNIKNIYFTGTYRPNTEAIWRAAKSFTETSLKISNLADLPKVLNIMSQISIQLLSEIFVLESITVHIFANHSSYFKN